MTERLRQFYRNRTTGIQQAEYLSQVGHTVGGQPIPDEHFDLLLTQIRTELELSASDRLLDICCGNGLFTCQLAKETLRTTGLDITPELIDIARSDHAGENISYIVGDACTDIPEAGDHTTYNKLLMFAALQHFTPATFREVLRSALTIADDDFIFFVGFIPDRRKIWRFHHTMRRRLVHLFRTVTGQDHFGYWWQKSEISDLCEEFGLQCQFVDIPQPVHASIYRFNVKFTRRHVDR